MYRVNLSPFPHPLSISPSFPHSLSISSLFPHSLSLSLQPDSKAQGGCAALPQVISNTIFIIIFLPVFLKNATKTVNNWLLICTNSSLLMISAMFKYVDEWSSRLDAGSLCGKIWKPLTKALAVLLPQHCSHDEWHHIVPGTEIKGHGGLPRGWRMSRGVKGGTGWMDEDDKWGIIQDTCI